VEDADRLDAIGAIGIARAFAFGGFKGDPIYNPEENPRQFENKEEYSSRSSSSVTHFYEKLLLLKDRMHTAAGRRMAERRHAFLTVYLDEFFVEWDARDLGEDVEMDPGRAVADEK
jgi:uncharacterized protein